MWGSPKEAGARTRAGCCTRVGVEPRRGVPPRPRPLDAHPAPFARGQAVACDMTEPDATTPWEGCPRSALKRVLGRLAERGCRSVASYEAEFYVWGPEGPLDRTPYAASFALTAAAEFVAELAEALEEMGIRPEQCHAEVGTGTWSSRWGRLRRWPPQTGALWCWRRSGASRMAWASRRRWPRNRTWIRPATATTCT